MTKSDNPFSPLRISSERGDALAKPIASSLGNASQTVLDGIFHLILDPVRRFNIQRDANLEIFKQEINNSIEKIPYNNQTLLNINQIGKILGDSLYQLDEKQFREYYASLIASSCDNRKHVKPFYSSLIKECPLKKLICLNIFQNILFYLKYKSPAAITYFPILIYIDGTGKNVTSKPKLKRILQFLETMIEKL